MASPLSEFVTIGPRASLHTPPNPKDGHLIIICTWLGAHRKHIAKFAEIYRNIAPDACILLIQSTVSILTSSYDHQRKEIQLATSAVLDSMAKCTNERPKILLHTFSNGGTNTATQLLLALRERSQKPLPLVGLLCDSCPAKGEYWKSYDAMLFSLPKSPVSSILGPPMVHGILILLYIWIACGNEPVENLIRRTLLDPQTVTPGSGVGEKGLAGRVCYLFSKEDRMCHWEDVRDHAIDARAQDWQTQEILFEGSAHCAHLRSDEAKYADAMKAMWDGTGHWSNPLSSKL